MIGRGAWIVLALLLVGCQTPRPTRVFEKHSADLAPLAEGARRPLVIDADTRVLDARTPFDFAVAHIPGALNIQWQEFSQPKGPFQGLLERDRFKLSRRLARLGIAPETRVVIVGKGLSGGGEEGRLAWTLYYLGVRDVQFASLALLKSRLTSQESAPPKPVAMWKPDPREGAIAQREEVLKAIATPESGGKKTHLIDVRSEKEYFQKAGIGLGYTVPDLKAIHIEWKQFFTEDGRPNLAIKDQLVGVGIAPGDRVIAISNKGVRSAAVTMALLAMGYERAGNYAGGLNELLNRK